MYLDQQRVVELTSFFASSFFASTAFFLSSALTFSAFTQASCAAGWRLLSARWSLATATTSRAAERDHAPHLTLHLEQLRVEQTHLVLWYS